MTKAERDALVVRRLDEYKETLAKIACLSSSLRETVRALDGINRLLYDDRQEDALGHALGAMDGDAVAGLPGRLQELRDALTRKHELASDLRGFGYGEFVRER